MCFQCVGCVLLSVQIRVGKAILNGFAYIPENDKNVIFIKVCLKQNMSDVVVFVNAVFLC